MEEEKRMEVIGEEETGERKIIGERRIKKKGKKLNGDFEVFIKKNNGDFEEE
jgi:hypothetical protein